MRDTNAFGIGIDMVILRLQKVKKIFKWIIKNIKYVVVIIATAFIFGMIKKITSKIGKVNVKKNWKPVPGYKNKVYVLDENGEKVIVDLPIDPKTKKQTYFLAPL